MNELNRTILITIIVTRMLMMVGAVQQQQNALDMSSRNKSVNSLSGKELKVVIGQLAVTSMVFRNESGHVTGYGGYLYEHLNWISIHMNFSLEMEASKDNAFGVLLDNGSWTGMRGQLQRKEVDIACTAFSGAVAYDVFDLAIFAASDGYGILTRYPITRSSNYGHIITFSPNVWIGLLISVIVCIGGIKLFAFLTTKYLNQVDNSTRGLSTLSDISIYILATLTNHGGQYQNGPRRAVRLVIVTWCFATFCFVNIYSSCLTSYMSLVYQRPEINTFQDLANNPNFKVTIFKGATAETIFLESKSGTMKKIGDKLRRCPDGICVLSAGNIDGSVQKVLDENNFVAVLPEGYIDEYVFKTMSRNQCRLTKAQETMAYRNYFMAVPKKSPFVMELNQASLWWHAFGLQNYWVKKAIRKAPQCKLNYDSQGESVHLMDKARLKLEQFYVPFTVLFIGHVLALIQFLRERFIRY